MNHNQIRQSVAMLPSAINLLDNDTIQKITFDSDEVVIRAKFTEENLLSLSFLNPNSELPAPGVYVFKMNSFTFILDQSI